MIHKNKIYLLQWRLYKKEDGRLLACQIVLGCDCERWFYCRTYNQHNSSLSTLVSLSLSIYHGLTVVSVDFATNTNLSVSGFLFFLRSSSSLNFTLFVVVSFSIRPLAAR